MAAAGARYLPLRKHFESETTQRRLMLPVDSDDGRHLNAAGHKVLFDLYRRRLLELTNTDPRIECPVLATMDYHSSWPRSSASPPPSRALDAARRGLPALDGASSNRGAVHPLHPVFLCLLRDMDNRSRQTRIGAP
jgi:hypothetical protein